MTTEKLVADCEVDVFYRFQPPDDGGSTIIGYEVQLKKPGTTWDSDSVLSNEIPNFGIIFETDDDHPRFVWIQSPPFFETDAFDVRIRALNVSGYGGWSNVVTNVDNPCPS